MNLARRGPLTPLPPATHMPSGSWVTPFSQTFRTLTFFRRELFNSNSALSNLHDWPTVTRHLMGATKAWPVVPKVPRELVAQK